MSAPTTDPASGQDRDHPSAKPVISEDELLRSDLTPLIRTTAFGARFIARAFTRVRIEGDTGAIPREGPVILAANHISNADQVLIGNSECRAWYTDGVDAAIRNAIQRANRTLRNLDWFEVAEIRGHILDGDIEHFQVHLKVGFRLEEE